MLASYQYTLKAFTSWKAVFFGTKLVEICLGRRFWGSKEVKATAHVVMFARTKRGVIKAGRMYATNLWTLQDGGLGYLRVHLKATAHVCCVRPYEAS